MVAGARAMSADPLQHAQEVHRRGQLAEAIAAYATFLEANPGRGDVWHMRALAEHQSGQLDSSWQSTTRAIEAGGEQPATMLLRGMLLQDRGDMESAQVSYARAAELRPGWAAPLANRGQALMDLGRASEGLEVLRAAAAIDAANPRVWNNIGLALLSTNRLDEAMRAFNQSISTGRLASAYFNIARLHHMGDDTKRALENAKLALQVDPNYTEAHLLLGDLYRKTRDIPAARASLATAARLAPGNARARNAYAEFLANSGDVAAAREEYSRIGAAHPGDFRAALGTNLLLPQVYRSGEDVERWRSAYTQGLDWLEANAERFRFASAREAFMQARWTNFFLAYQGRDDRELQRRYGRVLTQVLATAVPNWTGPRALPEPRARMRIGFCSHFFFNCTAGRYFASWITRLDRSRFEVFVYYTNERIADDTRVIMAAADQFRHIAGRSFDAVAHAIDADQLDALVYPELGMHGETFSLAALRLAPVQVAGWGHPTTTGLPSIDYFASAEAMEPADGATHYSEEMVPLPGLGTNYATPPIGGTGDRSEFGLPEGVPLYLIPQSMFKILPDNDELLARVMAADPRGKLVFFGAQFDAINTAFKERIVRAFTELGMSFVERAILLPYMTHAEYLRVNACCEVMLDTMHWSGGNTSLDAFASGLPVVTMPGRFMRGRQSAGMLRMMGVEELIVADQDAYVETAVGIANDPVRRAELSRRIREGHPVLFNRDEPIRALEDFLAGAIAKSRAS
jgi:protein O-GlcNAc transferase